jgi:hypothetical protein
VTRAGRCGSHRFAASFCGKTTRSGDLSRWPPIRRLVRKLNPSALPVICSGYSSRSTRGRPPFRQALPRQHGELPNVAPTHRLQHINYYSPCLGRPLDISITAVYFPAKRPTGVFLRYEATHEGMAYGTAVDAKAVPAASPHRRSRGERADFRFHARLLVLLCYKRSTPQIGQQGRWDDKCRESLMRSVAIEFGLCRSARTRPAGPKVGRKRGRA